MASSKEKYGSNYELPSIENQSYLFKDKFFSQTLLPYSENQPRKVYIISIFSYI